VTLIPRVKNSDCKMSVVDPVLYGVLVIKVVMSGLR
jgi:hypothetical protein